MAESAKQQPWEPLPLDDYAWLDSTTFGSGIARMIADWIMSHSGMEQALGLNYPHLARHFEFTEKQLRSAVERMVARGFALVIPAANGRDTYPEGGGSILVLLTPTRLQYEARMREAAEAKAARRAAKVAARGGRVNRAAIPTLVQARVYARDDFTCQKCGATEDLTLDHIKPWSLGGPDTVENLRVLCRPCNSRKGARH